MATNDRKNGNTNNGQVVRLPAVRMVRHKESMITSNVDVNSDSGGTPESNNQPKGDIENDRKIAGAPIICI